MGKLERLMNLTAALLETERPLTATELRSRVEGYPDDLVAFRRSFERDKDDLREMGIPVVTEPVPGTDPPVSGYRVHRQDYELPDPGLEPDELAALHLAVTAVRVDGAAETEALWKLGGVVGADAAELAALPGHPSLSALFGAIADRRLVEIVYHGERRTVEPHRLDFRRGRWYLSGHDRLRDADRVYRVDRIEGEVLAGRPGAFERPAEAAPGGRLEGWQLGGDDAVTATLLVDADQAAWVTHHLGRDAVVEERADGAVVVSLPVTDRAAFRSLVLTFLEHAEVLEPPELREDLVDWLRALAS